MDEEPKITASDILIGNVYMISEELLHTVYGTVETISKYETRFKNLSSKLNAIQANLNNYILTQKWMKGPTRKECLAKAAKIKELILICNSYAKICGDTIDTTIDTTQKFESHKKLQDMIASFVQGLEEELKKKKSEELDEEGD